MGDRPVRCSLSQIMKAFILLSLAATALATPARGGRRPQRGNKKEKVDPGNILRCAAENFGNNQTIKDCIECFSAEMDFTACSKEHLAPAYDECTKIMEAGTDPKAAHKCYNNILLGNVVSECINEKNVSTADAESLNSVVECGVENVFEWLQEKNPKAAKMLGGLLKKLGGDDDDDDDE